MIENERIESALHYGGLIVLVVLVVPFVVFAVPQVVGASHSYVVLSSSMSPTIHAGDVVIVDEVPAETIEEREIITFHPSQGLQIDAKLVTHRVVEVVHRDGAPYFRTKGDANEEPDQALVPAENVVGVVQFHIPYIGYVIQFANSGQGIVLFVIVPAVLLAANEIWTLWQAATGTTAEDDGDRADGDD